MKVHFAIIIMILVGILGFTIGYSLAPTDVETVRHGSAAYSSGGGQQAAGGGYGEAQSGGYGAAPASGGYGAPAAGGYGQQAVMAFPASNKLPFGDTL
jgi:hypothetical protein